jgi:GT2 family glycosyltransferase
VAKIKLSIIIVSYNTKELLQNCLNSLQKAEKELAFETIVVDNGSFDGSPELVAQKYSRTKLIKVKENLGFAAGNNQARKIARGNYILFLNSDTLMKESVLPETIKYLDEHPEAGALSCRLEMPGGQLDPDSRRSFPTPWVSFTHFSGLEKLFPKSWLFAQYRYGHRPENQIQEVEVIQAAFFLTRKKLLDKLGWFDETYFLDGEDIDLCWRIYKAGYKIIYFPKKAIIHIKKGTKGKSKRSRQTVTSGMRAMEIFYKKHLLSQYPFFINWLVLLGIKVLKIIRIMRFAR